MTTRYVGPGGNDANTGLSWAQRKLTLNGVEDTPVVAGDWVWVGPGVYRETLTCDVSGGAGAAITYAGDYTGANTDGVGGVVRITGSNDDQTITRNEAVTATSKNYRTFRGFDVFALLYGFYLSACTNITIEQCCANSTYVFMRSIGAGQAAVILRNCWVNTRRGGNAAFFDHSAAVSNCGHVVENCIFIGSLDGAAINISRIGGITVRNCLIQTAGYGVLNNFDLAVGQTITVNNCLIHHCGNGALRSNSTTWIVEDYNNLFGNQVDRTNVTAGAHSLAYIPSPDTRWFFELVNAGRMLSPFDLASYSQLVNVAGTSPTTTDMRGTAAIGGVREFGALEYDPTLLIEGGGGGGAVSISPFRGNIG